MVVRRQTKDGQLERHLYRVPDVDVAVRYGRLYVDGEALTDDTEYYSSEAFINEDGEDSIFLKEASRFYASSEAQSGADESEASEVGLSGLKVFTFPTGLRRRSSAESCDDGTHKGFEDLVRPLGLQRKRTAPMPQPLSNRMPAQPLSRTKTLSRMNSIKFTTSIQPQINQWKNITGPTPPSVDRPLSQSLSVSTTSDRISNRSASAEETASWGDKPLADRSPETTEWF